ncbi:hypothetical protein C0991_009631 [Blastosporella zonata]|nr:hypothetical protein C0991_009631 [Blastosporella zonata]
MKYSSALVVACIGSATLVAAEVTHETPAPSGHKPLTRAHSIAEKGGKAITVLGNFAKHASGNGYDTYNTDPSTNAGIYPRTRFPHIPHPSKPQLVEAAKKGKDLSRTAIKAGGGSQAVAENLGEVVNLVKNNNPSSDTSYTRRDGETTGRRRTDRGKKRLPPQTESGVEKTEVSPTVTSRDVLDDQELFSRGQAREEELLARGFLDKLKGNYHGRKAQDLTKAAAKENAIAGVDLGTPSTPVRRAFEEDDELLARGFLDKLKGNYHGRKAQDLTKEAAKENAIAGVESSGTPSTYGRAFEEDDELLARGFLDKLKGNYHGRKAQDLTKEAAKENAIAGVESSGTPSAYGRAFDDELDAREFDFEEELAARAFEEDELFGRAGFLDRLSGAYHSRKGQDLTKEAAKENAIAGVEAGSTPSSYRRELEDDILALRALIEFGDDLEARGLWDNIRNGVGALKDTIFGKTPAPTSTVSDPTAITTRDFVDDDELALRELYDLADELEARTFFEDELEARKFLSHLRNGAGALKDTIFGKKPAAAPGVDPSMTSDTNVLPGRDFVDDDELALRELYDLADELEARTFFEDELEARKFLSHLRNGAGALKDTIFGKKPAAAPGVDPSMTSDTNVLPGRDFVDDDELALRELYDLADELEARKFLSHLREGAGALKDTIFGKKPAVAPGTGVDPTMTSDSNALPGRDFVDEDELVLRDLEEYLDSRDFGEEFELFQREIPEELEARDLFEDELDARDFEIDELD